MNRQRTIYSINIFVYLITSFFLVSCGKEENKSQTFGGIFEKVTGFLFPNSNSPIILPKPGSLITENIQPELMQMLEAKRLGFADVIAKARYGGVASQPYKSLQELSQKNDWYAKFVSRISLEIDEHSKTDNFNIRPNDDRNRLFDKRWLTSADANFELIGLINRIDQREFSEGSDCGEIRLIYRLAYDKSSKNGGFSRLPMTLNWVYSVPFSKNAAGKACVDEALKWKFPNDVKSAEDFVSWLINTPLANERVNFKQLEVNLQVSRIVASNKPEFGGSATYFLMVFAPAKNGSFEPIKLRNTINADEINAAPALRAELVSTIKANVKAIDTGVYLLPSKFWTQKSVSRTTHGLNRIANMPFGQLLSTSEFKDLNFSGLNVINSPQALLRRLDDGTCAGCHQGDSVAGFHLLGQDSGEKIHPLNAIRVGHSQHFKSEMLRRQRDINTLASGVIKEPTRPFSFQSDSTLEAKAGHRCITPEKEKFLQKQASFGCGNNTGLHCAILEENNALSFEIGTCIRKTPTAGDPCTSGAISTNFANPDKDTMVNTTFACGGQDSNNSYVCLKPAQGVPSGLCYRKCKADLTAYSPGSEICAYNGGTNFDTCAASGDFSKCLISGTTRGLRQACDENTPCREDYICQSFFGIDAKNKKITKPTDTRGYCVPTYFIFQLRLDGHPIP